MAKVLSAAQLKQVDQLTVQRQGISTEQLVERAAKAFIEQFLKLPLPSQQVHLYCGTGHNGADGFAIACQLHHLGFQVHAYLLPSAGSIADAAAYWMQQVSQFVTVRYLDSEQVWPQHQPDDVLIDALFGAGVNRPLEGMAASLVNHLNQLQQQGQTIVSVDLPSGIGTDVFVAGPAITASYTITFAPLKLPFIMPQYGANVGQVFVQEIGLDADAVAAEPSQYWLTEEAEIRVMVKARARHSHKGHYGRALLAGGSHGKIGAMALATKACLRAGAGLVTAYVPRCGLEILQTSVPEAMVLTDVEKRLLTLPPPIINYNAIGIGPGMGTAEVTGVALRLLLEKLVTPVVLDADALNLLSLNPSLQALLPPGSILTPHALEFRRLAGASDNDFQVLDRLRKLAAKLKSIVIHKGAFTCIACADGMIYVNQTGNPGMATAGSGDVLTGIIVGLMAQGYTSLEAARLGTWLHGKAGDLATEDLGQQALIAGDIIHYLGKAWKSIS